MANSNWYVFNLRIGVLKALKSQGILKNTSRTQVLPREELRADTPLLSSGIMDSISILHVVDYL